MSGRRAASGFTLIELAMVLSITALLVPLIFAFHRQLETAQLRAQGRLDSAASIRSVVEELRRDGLSGWRSGERSFRAGACEITYVVEEGVLFRRTTEPCGGSRAIARRVAALEVAGPTRWRLTFAYPQLTQAMLRVAYELPVAPVEAR